MPLGGIEKAENAKARRVSAFCLMLLHLSVGANPTSARLTTKLARYRTKARATRLEPATIVLLLTSDPYPASQAHQPPVAEHKTALDARILETVAKAVTW